jgi:hypothetical protein
VKYWQQFRITVLKHDTTALAPMINDSLQGGCPLDVSDIYGEAGFPIHFCGKKISKSFFLSKIDQLFTPAFLSLLEQYDIKKDLEHSHPYRYRCESVIDSKVYSVYVSIDEYNVITYCMSCMADQQIEYYTNIQLKFRKSSSKIGLYKIDCEKLSISGGHNTKKGASHLKWNTKMNPKDFIEKSRTYGTCEYSGPVPPAPSPYYLRLFLDEKKYYIEESKDTTDVQVSIGKVIKRENIVECIDSITNQKLQLKCLDEYRLKIIETNPYYQKDAIIYLFRTNGNAGTIRSLHWKDGQKNGFWSTASTKGLKTIYYRKGMVTDSTFKAWNDHSRIEVGEIVNLND